MHPFELVRANDVAHAIQDAAASPTAQQGASVRFVGGGTTLIDLMKLNVEKPGKVIDINGLPLNKVEALSDGSLRIGALVRNSDLAHDPTVIRDYPVLSQALLSGASRPRAETCCKEPGASTSAIPLCLAIKESRGRGAQPSGASTERWRFWVRVNTALPLIRLT
jgi:hypothetical protein